MILSAPDLDFWVEVRLVGCDGRWIAVATIAGALSSGGATASKQR